MSEISGIIRNGIERGWSVDEIKNSLTNSGYSIQEVDSEIKLFNNPISQQIIQPIPDLKQQDKFNPQDLGNYQIPPIEKQASNKIVVLIIILLILCIVAGAGLFFLRV